MSLNVEETLEARGQTYGRFEDVAATAQEIKSAFRKGRNWSRLARDQREALELIATKIARILEGDPDYVDNWHDVAGYAGLIVRNLEGDPI